MDIKQLSLSYNKNDMKKIIVIGSLLSILLISCNNPQADGNTQVSQLGDFKVKIIDGCEYIEYSAGFAEQSVYSLTHKGNCKSCEERLLRIIRESDLPK